MSNYMTIDEVAATIRMSRKFVMNHLIKPNAVAWIPCGSKYRVDRASVEAWVRAHQKNVRIKRW
jgi:excisionase family DNA binding protein